MHLRAPNHSSKFVEDAHGRQEMTLALTLVLVLKLLLLLLYGLQLLGTNLVLLRIGLVL
jgi:hypothetical protein